MGYPNPTRIARVHVDKKSVLMDISIDICDDALQVPVQAHFGDIDKMAGFSDPAAAAGLRDKLATCPAAAACEVHMYAGESHGFMNPVNEETKVKRAAMGFVEPSPENQKLAWSRLTSFLETHLAA